MQWFIAHVCPEGIWISVQRVKRLHVTPSPVPLMGSHSCSPSPELLTVVDGDTDQSPQDRDQLKVLVGTTQLAWLPTPLPCSAMMFLKGGWEQGPAHLCCSPRDQSVAGPGHDPTGVLPNHLLYQHGVHGLFVEQRVFVDHLLQFHGGGQLCQDVLGGLLHELEGRQQVGEHPPGHGCQEGGELTPGWQCHCWHPAGRVAPAESWCLCSLPVPGTGCQSTDGIRAPTSSLLRPPSVKVLGCSCVMVPSRAKVSF